MLIAILTWDQLQPHLPMLLMAIGIGLLCYFIWRNSPSQRDEVAEKPARLSRSSAASSDDIPPEVTRWQVEMHATARELKGELDSKIMVLQALLKEVREEREKIEELLARVEEKTHERT